MTGQTVGYIRVSSLDQNTARQLDGVNLDKVFEDNISGATRDRPQLQEMISYVREGDTVIVHDLSRLARNLGDLRNIVEELNEKGVAVHFKKEAMIFTGDDDSMSKLLMNILGAVAEFERLQIKERQMEGIRKAQERGVYKGSECTLEDKEALAMVCAVHNGMKVTAVGRMWGVHRQTVYNYMKKEGEIRARLIEGKVDLTGGDDWERFAIDRHQTLDITPADPHMPPLTGAVP